MFDSLILLLSDYFVKSFWSLRVNGLNIELIYSFAIETIHLKSVVEKMKLWRLNIFEFQKTEEYRIIQYFPTNLHKNRFSCLKSFENEGKKKTKQKRC